MKMQAAPIPPHSPYPEVVKPSPRTAVGLKEPLISLESPHLPLLQDLVPTDRLHVIKKLRFKNIFFLRGKKNTFLVRTSDQTQIYTIEEENRSWWIGYFCYGLRPLQLRVINGQGTEVMRIHRPYSCTARVFPCQLQHLEVYSPPGRLIGTVAQQWTAVRPIYVVRNGDGDTLFRINGPYVTISCFRDVNFQIKRPDGRTVGTTSRHWQGLTHALIFAPLSDKFDVTFERSISVEEKGLLLATTLLMDYMYYDA